MIIISFRVLNDHPQGQIEFAKYEQLIGQATRRVAASRRKLLFFNDILTQSFASRFWIPYAQLFFSEILIHN